MGVELYIADLVAFVINFAQSTAAVTDIDSFPTSVVADIVGVITVIQPLQRCVRASIEDSNTAIVAIGNINSVTLGHVQSALWLLKAADRFHSFARLHVNDFQCVVPECGNKETLAFYVDGKMIDSSLHLGHFNGFLDAQGLRRLSPGHYSTCNDHQQYAHVRSPFNASALNQGLRTRSFEPPADHSLVVPEHTDGELLCRPQDCAPSSAPENPPAFGSGPHHRLGKWR